MRMVKQGVLNLVHGARPIYSKDRRIEGPHIGEFRDRLIPIARLHHRAGIHVQVSLGYFLCEVLLLMLRVVQEVIAALTYIHRAS